MRALITGGAGFAGSHLADHLLEQGQEVLILARPGGSLEGIEQLLPKIRLELADLRDVAALRRILSEVRPERIYHLAAFSSAIESLRKPAECYGTNFGGTLNLLEAWREIGFDTRLLLVSSSNVYGVADGAKLPFQENSPLRLENPYAESKAAAEFVAVHFGLCYGLPVVRVRPFQHTGPRQRPAYVCSGLARLRPPVLEVANPRICRDFSDVRDAVRGYALLLENGRAGEIYQVCSGRAVSVGTIIETLTARIEPSIDVRIEPAKARPGESQALWGDPAKAHSAVGWAPRYDLTTTLNDLLKYWEGQVRCTLRVI